MTVNYDKSEPERAHVNTKIWLDNAISSQGQNVYVPDVCMTVILMQIGFSQ